MDMQLHPLLSVGSNYLSSPKIQPLKFGNGCVISSHTLLVIWLIIHTVIAQTPIIFNIYALQWGVDWRPKHSLVIQRVESVVNSHGIHWCYMELKHESWNGKCVFDVFKICFVITEIFSPNLRHFTEQLVYCKYDLWQGIECHDIVRLQMSVYSYSEFILIDIDAYYLGLTYPTWFHIYGNV